MERKRERQKERQRERQTEREVGIYEFETVWEINAACEYTNQSNSDGSVNVTVVLGRIAEREKERE